MTKVDPYLHSNFNATLPTDYIKKASRWEFATAWPDQAKIRHYDDIIMLLDKLLLL